MYNNIEQNNRNKLLWRHSFIDGIKTGQTDDAGYCLAVSGIQDNHRLIAILLGAKSDEIRNAEAHKLLTWGFRFFTSTKVYEKGNILKNVRIWGGTSKNIGIGLADSVYLSLLKNDVDKITTNLIIPSLIKAPLAQGEIVGKYIVQLKGEVIAEYPAIALNTVYKGNLLNRISERISMYFNVITGNKVFKT